MSVRVFITEGTTADCKYTEKLIEGINAKALLATRYVKKYRTSSCGYPYSVRRYLGKYFGMILCRRYLAFLIRNFFVSLTNHKINFIIYSIDIKEELL